MSAFDALGPAFTLTNRLIFHRTPPHNKWRLGRAWKLASSAYVSALGAAFVPVPLLLLLVPRHSLPVNGPSLSILLVVALVYALLLFAFFYLGARMELTYFEMLCTQAQFVAPVWRKYRGRVWPWIGIKALAGTLLTLLLLPVMRLAMVRLMAVMVTMPKPVPGAPPNPAMFGAMMSAMLGVYGLMLLLMVAFGVVSMLLSTFVLPPFLLEGLPVFAAVRRGGQIAMQDAGSSLVYCLIKPVLALLGFIAQYISNFVITLPVLLVVVLGAVAAALVGGAQHGASPVLGVLLVAAGVLLYALLIVLAVWYGFASLGYLYAVLTAYGITFAARLYPLLAAQLAGAGSPDPYTFTPPPPPMDDPGSGPALPMDPALA